MTLIPGVIVPPPEPLRSRYGLFTAASGPLDLPPHGEGGGIRYVPNTCGAAYAYGVHCYDEDNPAPDKPHDPDNPEVATGVFLALATLECSAVGYTLPEFQDKVRRALAVSEQATVERALWTGRDLEGNPLDILTLTAEAEAVTDPYDPASIASVVGALEQYATEGYSFQPYLHAPAQVAAYAAEAGLIVQDGPIKRTPGGSVWVFGAYPLGEIIVTGQTTLWRAQEVQVRDTFEPTTNLRLLVAERAWAASFDCLAGRADFTPVGS